MNSIHCCKDCEDRHFKCWGDCVKYIKERKELNAQKTQRQMEMDQRQLTMTPSIIRNLKKRGVK